MTILYFDGSEGRWAFLLEGFLRTEKTGPCQGTSMEAEYHGLINGLEHCINLGISELEIRGDSQVVINQVLGGSKARNKEEKRLRNKVLSLLELMPNFTLKHIPRKENKADELFG